MNLAPADIRKEGAAFDLPIAIGVLAASEQLDPDGLRGRVFCGELALDGKVRAVTGTLSRVSALIKSGRKFVFPHGNLREASCVKDVALYPVRNLNEAVDCLGETAPWETPDSFSRVRSDLVRSTSRLSLLVELPPRLFFSLFFSFSFSLIGLCLSLLSLPLPW